MFVFVKIANLYKYVFDFYPDLVRRPFDGSLEEYTLCYDRKRIEMPLEENEPCCWTQILCLISYFQNCKNVHILLVWQEC